MAVYKPAGIVVHRSDGTPADEVALLQLLRDQIGKHLYPVHRLDQPTSGIVLFGLNSSAAASLVDQFTNRRVSKCYQALVVGWTHARGTVRVPLENLNRQSVLAVGNLAVNSELKKLQQAETLFSTLAWFDVPWASESLVQESCRLSLIEAMPRTGRWHQIRRHLTHIDHPILGDRRHGDDRYNEAMIGAGHADRLMLAACFLQFHHPVSKQLIQLRCDPDDDYQSTLVAINAYRIPCDSELLPMQPRSQKMTYADITQLL